MRTIKTVFFRPKISTLNIQRGKVAKSTAKDRGSRVQFTEGDQVLPIPNLTEHQTKSWQEFVDYGLQEVFEELNPIDDYTGQQRSLRFKDYFFKDPIESDQNA
ncbi:hypothetical protein IJ102_01990, partial [Candidatus Saccharibacteria bacterium]|nr:hypothetical protein [Candidatus Saccharibacteria bacterium]